VIIKATRISTASGAGGVGGHVYSHKGNEEVLELQGCREDLDDMVEDAERHGAKFSIRHVIISPEQATTREEALDLVREYAREFGGDADRAVVVEHLKPREDGEGFERHWHAMIPEVQNGRVLESSWMRARHEKLSRVAEIELGHGLVAGRWNKAVENALRADGRNDLADRVIPLTEGFRSTSSYTSDQHQTAKRAGLSMPHTKATAKAAAAATWSAADGGQAFVAALAEQNLRLKPGEKAGVILIEGQNASGEWLELGAVDRMIKGDRKDVANRLSGIDFESVFDQTRRLPVTAESLNGQAAVVMPVTAEVEVAPTTVPTPAAPVVGVAPPAVAPITEVAATVPADTVSAPQPMAAPASPGHAPVRAADGGKAAATVGGDSDPILNAPDPKVPGSVERWLMAVGEQEQRKAKRAVEALSKLTEGGEGGPDKKQIEEIRRAINSLFRRSDAAYANRSGQDFGGHDGDLGEPGNPSNVRPQGAVTGGLRGVGGGEEYGRFAGAEGVVGSPEGGREGFAGPGGRAADADRRQPSAPGGDAGRRAGATGENGQRVVPDGATRDGDRESIARGTGRPDERNSVARQSVARRRTEKLLAAAVASHTPDLEEAADRLKRQAAAPAVVAPSPDRGGLQAATPQVYQAPTWPDVASRVAPVAAPKDLAIEALRKAMRPVERILAKEPWQKPDDRLVDRIREAIVEPLMAREKRLADTAKAARGAVDERRQAAGFFERWRPSYRAEVHEMAAVAESAEQEAARARVDPDSYSAWAQATVKDRQAERRGWLDRPETKEAFRAAEELKLVEKAVKTGDPEVTDAAAKGDLKEARKLAMGQLNEQQRAELERHLAGYAGGAPRPGGPGGAPGVGQK